ncbi:MAG: NACHT domain-containing protein, partial [Chloroflexota bacterium]
RYQNFADVIQQMRIILYEKPSTTISSAYPKKLIDHNRQSMLQNMRQFWIKGMLENSLTNSLIELSLLTNTDAVERPWDAILRKTDSSQTALPVKANSLLEVFDQANGKLLILGAPGSGKTTMLLQLLQDLLTRAESDPEYLIPVVVNLSTWGELMRPLEQWLKSRLIDQYYVPENIAEQWIQNDKLTILLDGLDEVEEGKRHQCTRAINAFRRDHGFCDIVVTSRTTEYMELADQLVLNAVINIQPLNDTAIFSYLNNFPDDTVKALTTVLHDDTNLRDLCRSPFILVTMAIAYRNVSVEEISYFDTFAERRLHLFSAYIDRMVEMSDDLLKYDPTEFRHYLGYIAKQMVSRSMTVFAVESPQPYWLNDDEKIRVMRLSSIIYFSLFLFLLVLAIVLTPNYLYGLIILISLILSSGGASAQGITLSGSFKFDISLIEGLVIPSAFALIWYILSLPQAILVATILVLLLGFEMSGDVSVKQNITPGDVIRRNYLVILAVFVISLVIITLVASLVFTMPQGLIMGLIFATLIIIAKTNIRGLLLFYTLRLHLTNQYNLPLRLKAFLENAVTLLMVRRIGSSYIFIHRYLLEYFAETFTTKR